MRLINRTPLLAAARPAEVCPSHYGVDAVSFNNARCMRPKISGRPSWRFPDMRAGNSYKSVWEHFA